MEVSVKRGPGQFQWNRAGWFGAQIGSTLWLVLLGGLLLAQGELIGGLAVVLGLLPNVIGILLWRRRQSLSPYLAVQMLVGITGVCAVIALVALSTSERSQQAFHTSRPLWFLLVFPFVMLMFHLQERAGRSE